MEKTDNKMIIKCPYCGTEYLPGEIYIPNDFVGQPSHVDRDEEGKIESYIGKTMGVSEEYICDRCNKKFGVLADVSFKTAKRAGEEEFEEVYYTQLYPKRYKLKEE